MDTQENDKKVLIYFYYLAITRQKEASDTSTYDIAQIMNVFSKMLEYTLKKSLKDRRQELTFAEKVVWLDSFEDMGMEIIILLLNQQNTIMSVMKLIQKQWNL